MLTPVAGPAARWKPCWWRTAVLGRPLEELLDLWAQTDWAQVDCRLQGHERPGSRLSAPDVVRSSGAGPRNVKSTGRPCNRPPHHPRRRSVQVLRHPIRPPVQRRLCVPRPSLPATSALERERSSGSLFSFQSRFPAQTMRDSLAIQAIYSAGRI
jgi:hypothetical protein